MLESPGTPSNASLSEGRDFLIDDEIADQPQLCFSTHDDVICDKGNNNGSEGTGLIMDQGTFTSILGLFQISFSVSLFSWMVS